MATKGGGKRGEVKPAVLIERPVEMVPVQAKVSVRLKQDMDEYLSFHEAVTGYRPTQDKFVETSLEKVLRADKAFQNWKRQKSGKGANDGAAAK